jgi:hypothetical protein
MLDYSFIPPLRELSLWRRITIAVATVLIAIVLVLLVNWLEEAQGAEPLKLFPPHPANICGDDKFQEQVRALMYDGLDNALRDRTRDLFEGWMRDASDQPLRAARGLYLSINAYVLGRVSIEQWSLPKCKP